MFVVIWCVLLLFLVFFGVVVALARVVRCWLCVDVVVCCCSWFVVVRHWWLIVGGSLLFVYLLIVGCWLMFVGCV